MRLPHPDYITLVIETYKKRRSNNSLSPLLAKSSPAKIKRECLNVYKERYDKKDDNQLRAFFGPVESGKPFTQVIRKFETSKFKPLDSYLKGKTDKTDDKNIDLLAWLLDFPLRPWELDKDVTLTDEEIATIEKQKDVISGIEEPKDEKTPEKQPQKNEPNSPSTKRSLVNEIWLKLKKVAAIFLFAVACLEGVYIIGQQENSIQKSFQNANITRLEQRVDSLMQKRNKSTISNTKSNDSLAQEVHRCQGITLKGVQCKRKATEGDYCWQHAK